MAGYKLSFKKSAFKELQSLPKKDLKAVLSRIEEIAENPRGLGCEKLSGSDRYRARQGDYRIVYSIQDEEVSVWIVKIGHRKDVYRH